MDRIGLVVDAPGVAVNRRTRLRVIVAYFRPRPELAPAPPAAPRVRPRSDLRAAIEAALREVPRRSDRAIAKVLDCDNSHVGAVRRQLGIPAGPRDRTKRDRNAVLVEMARAGLTYAEIGWRLGIDKTRANQLGVAGGVRRIGATGGVRRRAAA